MKYKSEREWQKDLLLKDGDYTSYKDIIVRINQYIPKRNILADLDKQKNIVNHTAKDIYETICNLGDGLISLGEEHSHIGILANNQYRYILADIAISAGVGVVTPIDKDAPKELLITLLNKAEINAVFVQDYLIEDIEAIKKDVKTLKNIYVMNKQVEGYKSFDDIVEIGKKAPKVWLNKELDLDSTSMILFTSGTTGANKAVMLTQRNLAANAMNCLDIIAATDEENTSMSVLPFHHATEINTHVMARIAAGRLTYINESMKEMMINMKIFKPTCVTIVPMIANMFYKTIWQNAKKAGMDKKLKMGIKICKLVKKLTGKDITHKLFADIFVNFGGNLREIVVGGAMLSPEVVSGLAELGILMCNGYGITECGPLISLNSKTIKDPYSVGVIAPTLQYKVENIDEDGYGELCVKGPSVAKGYYKDEKATKEAFDQDGYFHTGDMVRVDKHKVINMSENLAVECWHLWKFPYFYKSS